MLVAQLTDAVNLVRWRIEQQIFEDPPQPEPIPRPGVLVAKPTGWDGKAYDKQDPVLAEWLARRIKGEDTSDLGLDFENVVPFQAHAQPERPTTK
jgi:hypothetical protein